MYGREKIADRVNILQVSKQHRRTRLDIMADILKVSAEGIGKTRLMYCCNLSFLQSKKYLCLLVQKGLLRSIVAKKSLSENLFETTQKGKAFLRTYRNLRVLLTS